MIKAILKNTSAAILIAVTCGSCDTNAGNMDQMKHLKDTMFATMPQVASITLQVYNDTTLNVAIGSEHYYKSSEANQQQLQSQIIILSKAVFGDNSKLKSGQIFLTDDETNTNEQPANAIVLPIQLN
jgi:hypothetical protein